jgi:hypothetical protein
LKIKFILILILKLRALFVGTLWRRGNVLMEINVNLLMDLLNLNATLINRCHIRLDNVMLSLEKDTVLTDPDVTFYIEIKMKK